MFDTQSSRDWSARNRSGSSFGSEYIDALLDHAVTEAIRSSVSQTPTSTSSKVRRKEHVAVGDDHVGVTLRVGGEQTEVHVARDAEVARAAVVAHAELAAQHGELLAPAGLRTVVVEHDHVEVVLLGPDVDRRLERRRHEGAPVVDRDHE